MLDLPNSSNMAISEGHVLPFYHAEKFLNSVATLHAIFSSQESYIESLPLIQKYLLSEQSISQGWDLFS